MNNFNLQVPAVYAYSHQPSPHWQPQPVFSHYPQQQRTVVYSTPPPQGGGAVSPRVYLQQQHTRVHRHFHLQSKSTVTFMFSTPPFFTSESL